MGENSTSGCASSNTQQYAAAPMAAAGACLAFAQPIGQIGSQARRQLRGARHHAASVGIFYVQLSQLLQLLDAQLPRLPGLPACGHIHRTLRWC